MSFTRGKINIDMPAGDVSDKSLKLRIHIFARGERCSLTSTLDLPFREAKYDLTQYDYPLCRYGTVQFFEGNIHFDGECIPMDRLPMTLQRVFHVESAFDRKLNETHIISFSMEFA